MLSQRKKSNMKKNKRLLTNYKNIYYYSEKKRWYKILFSFQKNLRNSC